MKILEMLKDVLRESIPEDCDDITATSSLVDDLGFDSLDRVEVTMGIEERFDIQIRDDEAELWKSVGDIVAYLETVLPLSHPARVADAKAGKSAKAGISE